MDKELEWVIRGKVRPLLADALQKNLGITVAEIEDDISSHLQESRFVSAPIDISVPFKIAKRLFRRLYLSRLLQLHSGHVTAVARAAGITREALHRLLKQFDLSADRFRSPVQRVEYMRVQAVQGIIKHAISQHEESLNPTRVAQMYRETPALSRDIVKILPEKPPTLKQAEHSFERAYIQKALKAYKGNISAAAKAIGIRFETLHRKCKSLGMRAQDF